MFDLLLEWMGYEFTFYEEAECVCPSCHSENLILDILDDEYVCRACDARYPVDN